MKNIYLVGFMGTGKTAVGHILAEKLQKTFVEMDEVIERKEGKKIVDIFAQKGESYFRKLETTLLEELSQQDNLVISCGGGLICNPQNLRILKQSGIIFNLQSSPEKIYERTRKHTHRPLLNVENPLEKIKNLLAERTPFYQQAHYTVESEEQTPEQVADYILEILNKLDN
jgi:shikimate kinase